MSAALLVLTMAVKRVDQRVRLKVALLAVVMAAQKVRSTAEWSACLWVLMRVDQTALTMVAAMVAGRAGQKVPR